MHLSAGGVRQNAGTPGRNTAALAKEGQGRRKALRAEGGRLRRVQVGHEVGVAVAEEGGL